MSQSVTEFLANIDSLLTHLHFEKKSQIFFRKGMQKYDGDTPYEVEFKEFVDEIAGRSFLRAKVYSYQNAIISLYGYFERYLEDIVVEYLKGISKVCPEYKLLPSSVKKNHLSLSLDLINKIQKIKGWTIEKRKMRLSNAVNSMRACLHEERVFNINYDAFINHTSNFRYDTIHEVFCRIGIDAVSRKCLKDEKFIFALCRKHSIEGCSNHKFLISLLMSELEDLVQRRNEIAHGVRIDDIESNDITISRIRLIKAYVQAIDRVVMSYLEQYTFSVLPSRALGKATKVFPDLNVIGFAQINPIGYSDTDLKISEGTPLFAENSKSSRKVISGKIISLQIDGVPQKEVVLPCDKPVSMGVSFDVSANFIKRTFYAVPAE